MPDLSVIILTPDSYKTIHKTIHLLSLQSVKSRMEIVIVAPSLEALSPDLSLLNQFEQYRVVQVGKIKSIGSAYAAGVREASAPVVALAEEHSFPKAGWAEAFLEAHHQAWAAVGPVVLNANPYNSISWADLYIAYGRWLEPGEKGSIDHLPGHNSSYKRDILLQYGSALEVMMEAESVMHWDLRSKGYQLCLEPAAQTLHTNFGELSTFLLAQFYSGRQFAASRVENESWPLMRKLFYSAASPLIPAVRLYRILKNLRHGDGSNPLITVLPALLLGLFVDAAGQSVGFTFGAGDATRILVDLEFHRDQHMGKSSR